MNKQIFQGWSENHNLLKRKFQSPMWNYMGIVNEREGRFYSDDRV